MRKLIIIALMAIVLVSGCLNLGGTKAIFGFSEVMDNPDIYLKMQSLAQDIKAGRYAQIQFTVENKGDDTLEGVNVTAYDQCLFTGESRKEVGELRPNRSSMWSWKWQAGDTDFEGECAIKFRTQYSANTSVSRMLNVLDESEYYTREEEGTLSQIRGSGTSSYSSLRISIDFSGSEPFLEDENLYAYIDYSDVGYGLIQDIKPESITITVPSNLKEASCTGYELVGTKLVLKDNIRFIDGNAPQTTCKFKTYAEQPIETGEIRITATYKYQFDNSLLLKVTPK